MKRTGVILLLFFFLTAAFTFPLIFKFNTSIPGFHSTDEPYGILWHFWWLKYSHLHNLKAYFSPFIISPLGLNLAQSPIYPVGDFIDRFLAVGFGEITAYNIQIFISFILSGIFMYYLVYFLTKNRMAAVFSGIAYTFSPYHVIRSWQHPSLAQIQWFPLFALSLYRLKEKADLKNIIFASFSFCLIAFFNYYYVYFALIIAVVFMAFVFIFERRQRFITIKATAISLLAASLIILPVILPIFKTMLLSKNSEDLLARGYLRPFKDLFEQSARPLSYFLPATVHPILGKFTGQFIGTSLYGTSFTEHTLYLGWVPLILAFVAIKKWRTLRREKSKQSALGTVPFGDSPYQREDFYIGFFLLLAFIAWLFSQAPWWEVGPVKIFMPSSFLYKILPMFRAYCRFGILVMLAIAVLAGFGLNFILDSFKAKETKIVITALFCGLVLFEFWSYPSFKVIDLSKVPAVYYWLKKQQGDFIIAEYPLDVDGANEMYKFFQTKHEKKIINGTIAGTYAHRVAQAIAKLSEAKTAGTLKWMGVKYVLVHRDGYLNTGLLEDRDELNIIDKNPGLRFIRSFAFQECPQDNIICAQKTGPIDVYEVVASPFRPRVE